jgi:hypothetical protein
MRPSLGILSRAVNTSRESAGAGVQVFQEDRDDVVRRALPRLAVGHLAIFTGICVLALLTTPSGNITWGQLLAMDLGLTVFSLLLRGDVWALQFGRQIRYEISDTELRAFRGERETLSFRFDEVKDWIDCRSPTTFQYWVGSGYYREFALPFSNVLATYTFTLGAREDRWAPFKQVAPPALFRWADRGGLEDVSAVLRERLGTPWNTVS